MIHDLLEILRGLVSTVAAVIAVIAWRRSVRSANIARGARDTYKSLQAMTCLAPIDFEHPGTACLRPANHPGEHAYTVRALEAVGYAKPPF